MKKELQSYQANKPWREALPVPEEKKDDKKADTKSEDAEESKTVRRKEDPPKPEPRGRRRAQPEGPIRDREGVGWDKIA